jgi:hypothetical protein
MSKGLLEAALKKPGHAWSLTLVWHDKLMRLQAWCSSRCRVSVGMLPVRSPEILVGSEIYCPGSTKRLQSPKKKQSVRKEIVWKDEELSRFKGNGSTPKSPPKPESHKQRMILENSSPEVFFSWKPTSGDQSKESHSISVHQKKT